MTAQVSESLLIIGSIPDIPRLIENKTVRSQMLNTRGERASDFTDINKTQR